MRSRTQRAITLSLGVGLMLCVAANLFSAWSLRPLQNDGAFWVYNILKNERFHWPGGALDRLFTLIWQAPLLALLKIAGTRDWVRLELLTFELPYCLHPFLSLALSAWICRNAKVPWMFLFPLASYATATNLTHGYAVGEVPSSLSVFWPLFLVVLLKPFGQAGTRLVIVAGACILANTHSWAFLLFLPLLVPAQALAQRALFLAASMWLLYLGAFYHYGYSAPFRDSFLEPWGAFATLAISGSLIFTALAAWGGSGTSAGRQAAWAALGTASAGAFAYLGWALAGDPIQARATVLSYYGRVPAIPVACFLAFSLLFINSRVPRTAWSPKPRDQARWHLAAASLAPMLLLGALYTVGQAFNWRESLEFLRDSMDRNPQPCRVMPEQDYKASFLSRGNWAIALPSLSLLIQETRVPKQIVVHESYVRDVLKRDFCSEVAQGFISWPWISDDLRHGRHLTIERIIESMAKPADIAFPDHRQ